MSLVLVTPPVATSLLTLEQAKQHLRVDWDGDDALITAQLATAIVAAEKHTGRTFVSQQWDYFCDAFPTGCADHGGLGLPLRPVISVDAIAYRDDAGEEQVWPAPSYATYGLNSESPALVLPAPGGAWPQISACRPEAVRVRFTAGYQLLTHPDLTSVRSAALLILGDLYENREDQVIAAGTVTQIKNPAAQALLAPYRVW